MIQNLINHIVFVIDGSGSMIDLKKDVIRVFDNQIEYLIRRSKELNQETRVSVYIFNSNVTCLIYDTDVLRLPALDGYFDPNGNTALIDGTMQAILDLQKTPELYGDHSFLIYVITDGQENFSKKTSIELNSVLSSIPNNWTVGVLVPDQIGVYEAKNFGFPADNIKVWKTTSAGINEVDTFIKNVTENFFVGRLQGIRGSKSMFTLNINGLSAKDVKFALTELSPSDYKIVNVYNTSQIRDIVTDSIGHYEKGKAYYQLTKPETIQDYKQVCIRIKSNGKIYAGSNARNLLGFPTGNFKLKPEHLGKYDVFIQSTSVNRKVLVGTQILVLV